MVCRSNSSRGIPANEPGCFDHALGRPVDVTKGRPLTVGPGLLRRDKRGFSPRGHDPRDAAPPVWKIGHELKPRVDDFDGLLHKLIRYQAGDPRPRPPPMSGSAMRWAPPLGPRPHARWVEMAGKLDERKGRLSSSSSSLLAYILRPGVFQGARPCSDGPKGTLRASSEGLPERQKGGRLAQEPPRRTSRARGRRFPPLRDEPNRRGLNVRAFFVGTGPDLRGGGITWVEVLRMVSQSRGSTGDRP